MKRHHNHENLQQHEWRRADPEVLAKFNPLTKECMMGCGPHRHDPRTWAEIKLMCGNCVPSDPNKWAEWGPRKPRNR